MSPASKEDEKIINENFDLIQLVVTAINIDSYIAVLNNNLDIAEKNGWTNLVSAIRKIISGKKEKVVLDDLDYEDQVISSKIL
ncbi:MAG TPA: hypothetical protein ENJ41_00360, partial [Oceanospirillales bacterium]|nr:hypothetical protein [Oceanospirillales bacterium]